MATPSTSPKPSLDGEDPTSERNNSISTSSRSGSTSTSIPDSPRRKSIQFNIGRSESQPPSRPSSVSGSGSGSGSGRKSLQTEAFEKEQKHPGRGYSPPPPQTYERGVSFDTFDNPDAADFSLTLNYKHKGYQSTRRSRTFLCGTDQNDYSDFALEWLIDELVDDGDEIVCLRVVEKDSSIASDAAVEAGKYRQEAERLFEQVIQKNSQNEKAISLVLELAVGKVQEIIQRMIKIYEPAVLIVGTRGRNLNGVQSLLPGSVSKYCLQQSPIPVIVVRPSPKREKKKKKRLADPNRRSYNQILELSERQGSHIFSANSSRNSSVARLPDEEAAVAAALGLPQAYANSRTSLSTSDRSSVSHDGSVSPMADALEPVHRTSTTESADYFGPEERSDQALSSASPDESENGLSSNEGSLTPSETPSPIDEINSADSTPQPSSPKVSIPVIVTEDIATDPEIKDC